MAIRPAADFAPLRVAFVLCPNFTLMAFAGFVDILRLCGDDGDRSRQIRCQWTVLGPTIEPVRASCGVLIAPWETFRDPKGFDYIVVVGGQLDDTQGVDPRLAAYLRRAASLGVTLVGVCTGSFVLAGPSSCRGAAVACTGTTTRISSGSSRMCSRSSTKSLSTRATASPAPAAPR
ncbi:MAG: DJ-1/PfpI family protein [Betaproteobacteria bacterium]|nr:DJ-1/PfpI family protein [Betaproteobacteria bacterium]